MGFRDYFSGKKKKAEDEQWELGAQEDPQPVISGEVNPTPLQGTTISKKAIIIIVFFGAALISYVFASGMQSSPSKSSTQKAEDEFNNRKSIVAKGDGDMDEFKNIPSTYGTAGTKDKKQNQEKSKSTVANTPQIRNQRALQPQLIQRQPQGNVSFPNQLLRSNVSVMSLEESERDAARNSPIRFSISQLASFAQASQDEPEQVEKIATQEQGTGFLDKIRNSSSSFYLKSSVQQPLSQYEVKAGTIIPGVMITGINSDLQGEIVGQVRENVYDSVTGQYLLIPVGAKLIGSYDSDLAYAQDRVFIAWQRIIFPNGSSLDLEGMIGVDMGGYSGFKDKKNSHTNRVINSVLIGSILTAGARIATGGVSDDASFSRLAGQGVAENILQATGRITEKNLNIQPTLEIQPGYMFNVFVNKDFILPPYNE